MERWRESPVNTLICTEPDFPLAEVGVPGVQRKTRLLPGLLLLLLFFFFLFFFFSASGFMAACTLQGSGWFL